MRHAPQTDKNCNHCLAYYSALGGVRYLFNHYINDGDTPERAFVRITDHLMLGYQFTLEESWDSEVEWGDTEEN